ncbi:tyrosine-protein phosphatase [Nocardia sp. R16R-3T]
MNQERIERIGLVNFRDLGGLPLEGGGRTRCDQVFRSDAPFDRSDLPADAQAMTWATVVDLRSEHEFGARVAWEHGGSYHRVALMDRAAPESLAGNLPALYADLATRGGRGFVRVVELVARADGPTLVHCSLGKDRTGVAVALLLLVAGVERQAVVADYMQSGSSARQVLRRFRARGFQPRQPVPAYLFDARAEALEAALAVIEQWPGRLRGYLLDHGATDCTLDAVVRRLASKKQDRKLVCDRGGEVAPCCAESV